MDTKSKIGAVIPLAIGLIVISCETTPEQQQFDREREANRMEMEARKRSDREDAEARKKGQGYIKGTAMSRLKIGMAKEEVLKILGPPQNTSAKENVEILRYLEDKGWWQKDSFFVRLVQGVVESYGLETPDLKLSP